MGNHPVIFQVQGCIGVATLNRPAALNSLNLEMFQSLRVQLHAWCLDPKVSLIVIQGAGDKGFCAGGDVKTLALELRDHPQSSYAQEFFTQEYSLDYFIHTSPKPILVIGHGITMGGGIGLMVGATCRILTETSVLAMPEITIGYFTDVGSSYFLSRMPNELGLFLGLTAARLTPSDALYLGLADFVFSQNEINFLMNRLSQQPPDHPCFRSREGLHQWMRDQGGATYSQMTPSWYETHVNQISQWCSGNDLLEIQDRFSRAQEISGSFENFFSGSPTSAFLIFHLLRRGRELDLKSCFDLELNVALQCCKRKEFIEGVRALLIDKDRKPKWNPARMIDVNPQEIEAHFQGHLKIETKLR